jgi:phosphoribosylglycinamide formyltransferase 1
MDSAGNLTPQPPLHCDGEGEQSGEYQTFGKATALDRSHPSPSRWRGAGGEVPLPIAVLLSGTGRTLANLLDQIERGGLPIRVGCVIGSKPGIRGLAIAEAAGVPTHIIRRGNFVDSETFSAAVWETIAPYDVRLVVLGGFLHKLLVPSGWEGRVLNIHPSLLPAFGGKGMYGRHVHEAVLAHGCKVTGCTVHICDDAYDAGPIVAQQCVPVLDDDTPETLGARVFAAECALYPTVIRAFAEGRIQQRGRRVTIAPGTLACHTTSGEE